MDSFLRGHVEAFTAFGGCAGSLLYDNLKSAVLERQGDAIRVSLIDRLMHRAEVVRIEGKSYRQKEADEREIARRADRAARKTASRSRKAAP